MACPTMIAMKDNGFLFACTDLQAEQKLCSYSPCLRTINLEIRYGVRGACPTVSWETVAVTKCLCYLLVPMSFTLHSDYSRAQLYYLPICWLKILQSKLLEGLLRLCNPPFYQKLFRQSFLLTSIIMNPHYEIQLIIFFPQCCTQLERKG